MTASTITLDSREEALLLFGSRDTYLREIKNALGAQVVGRGDQILVKGSDDQLALAERIFAQLRQMLRQQGALTMEEVKSVLEVVTQTSTRVTPTGEKVVERGRFVKPRTDGQA